MSVSERTLADLFTRSDEFAELQQALDVFCPFVAIGMVRQEIRHAHFLAYILDPLRPHGFGDACLRAFLAAAVEALGDGGDVSSLDIHLMNLRGAIIRREWHRIDLLIEVPLAKLVVAIELKIDASERQGQLKRYQERLKSERPDSRHMLLFLTKFGDDPTDDADIWTGLELSAVAEAFDTVLKMPLGEPQAKAMLAAYLAMLRRHHLTDERLERLAADLWSKHREALEFLAERQPDELTDVMNDLILQRDDIAAELSKSSGLTVVPDEVSGTSTIRFAVREWDSVDGVMGAAQWTSSKRLILAEIKSSRGRKVSGFVVLGRGDAEIRRNVWERLLRQPGAIKSPDRYSPDWKRLTSKTLVNLKDDQEVDAVELAKKLRRAFVDLVGPALATFDKALRPVQIHPG